MRSELKLLGRILGTYDGWDAQDETTIFYNVKLNVDTCRALAIFPNNDKQIDISTNSTTGIIQYEDGEDNVIWARDLVNALVHLPVQL